VGIQSLLNILGDRIDKNRPYIQLDSYTELNQLRHYIARSSRTDGDCMDAVASELEGFPPLKHYNFQLHMIHFYSAVLSTMPVHLVTRIFLSIHFS